MSLTVHINSLPDLVLRRIFSKVPLTDLLHTASVCPLWKYYQVETGKQVRSLTLLIGPTAQSLITNSCFTLKYRDLLLNDDGTRMYSSQYLHKHYHLTYGTFTLDCAVEISNIFSCVTSLEIAIKDVPNVKKVFSPMVHLLAKWSPMVKSLKMYLQHPYWIQRCDEETNEFPNLLAVINSMPLLEHFTLDSVTPISPLLKKSSSQTEFYNSIDLPILGRLREFYFNSVDYIDIIEESLKSYALSSDNLKQLGLNYIFKNLPQLASKIAYLPLEAFRYRSPEFFELLKLFSSNTNLGLKINFFDEQYKGLLKLVSLLLQLTHLHLDTTYTFAYKYSLAPASFAPDLLPQLCSIQVLTITLASSNITSSLESSHWSHLFPNVQVIELVLNSAGPPLLEEQQLRGPLSNFVQCSKLHHIYTCENRSIWPLTSSGTDTLPDLLIDWIVIQDRDRKIIVCVDRRVA